VARVRKPELKGSMGTRDDNYKPEVMLPYMLKVFSEGHDIAAFCSHFGMCRDTFFSWLKRFPDFAQCYKDAKEKSRIWWEIKGMEGLNNPHFNQNVWRLMMRNRFDMADTRIVPVPFRANNSPKQNFNVLNKEIAEGRVTPDEAIKLANYICSGLKVEEASKMRVEIDMLMEKLGIPKEGY